VQDLIGGLGRRRLVTVDAAETVQKAMELMQQYDIEQIPVKKGNEITGSVSQNGLFKKLMQDINLKEQQVETVQEAAIPVVAMNTPIERLTGYITKDNGAILAKDETGDYHIITKYDVLNALSKG
jgi:cystathionine beta-synthase